MDLPAFSTRSFVLAFKRALQRRRCYHSPPPRSFLSNERRIGFVDFGAFGLIDDSYSCVAAGFNAKQESRHDREHYQHQWPKHRHDHKELRANSLQIFALDDRKEFVSYIFRDFLE